MRKSFATRLDIGFRVVMLLLTALSLFLGVISINNKINRVEPSSGLLAIKGDSFIHVTADGSNLAEDRSSIRRYSEEELILNKHQVLVEVVGENADNTLAVRWSDQDFRAGRQELHFSTIREGKEELQWEEHFEDYREMFKMMDEALGVGGILRVQYIRSQQSSDTALDLVSLEIVGNKIPININYFVDLSAGFAFLAIGLIIYFSTASRRLAHSMQFFLLSLLFFILFSFDFANLQEPLGFFIFWFYKAAFLLAPPVLLHFLYLISRDQIRWSWSSQAAPFYFPSTVLLILNAAVFLFYLFAKPVSPSGVRPPLLENPFFDLLRKAESLLFPLLVIFGLIIVFRAFRQTYSPDKKKQLKWLFWGIGIGLLPQALIHFPFEAFDIGNQVINLAVSLPLFVTPFSFAFAAFRQRFLDVEVMFKRGFVYLTTSFSLLGLYLLLMYGLSIFSGEITNETLVIIGAAMILLATLVSHRIKDQIQLFFDRFLYRDFYNFRRTLQSFSLELSYERDLNKLLEKISSRVEKTFSIPVVVIFISSANKENFVMAHSTVAQFPVQYLSKEASQFIAVKMIAGHPVYIDQLGEFPATDVFKEAGVTTVIPFLSLGDAIGFLALGNTSDGDILNTDDLELLTSLAGRAAASIDNAMLYLDLQNQADELRTLKEFHENIVESVDSGICAIGMDGKVRSWNNALEELFFIKREEAVGKHFLDLLPLRLANVMEPYIVGDFGTSQFHNLYKVSVINRKKEQRMLNISIAPLGEAFGRSLLEENVGDEVIPVGESGMRGVVVIIDDITDGVKMEEQLQQQEKMASLGILAAGVAHEVNTPLTGISSYIQMLQRKMNGDADSIRLLEKVEKQAFRASKIINNLLSFSRQGSSERTEVNFNSLITDSLALVENQLRSPNVRVTTDLAGNLNTIVGDRIRLQQVLINLLLNARDSMPGGGELKITTWNENENIVCTVEDTGTGIAKDIQGRIFDPFFTTKEYGQGTGLGLSVSYGILQEHKGSIDFESAVNKGTKFIISLPVVQQ